MITHNHKNAAWMILGSIFFVLLFSGCATAPQTRALLESNHTLNGHSELTDVPFFAQKEYQCGPAALATVFNWNGLQIHPDELTPQVYIPAKQGSLQIEMLAAVRRQHLIPYQLSPRLEDVFAEVDHGQPVLIFQNLGLDWYPVWHYAVVVGYDLQQREVILRSGEMQRRVTPLKTFEQSWRKGQYWAVVVNRPENLPKTAQAQPYFQTLVKSERFLHSEEMLTAYQAALQRWPDNLDLNLAMANFLMANKRLEEAERHYRHALAQDASHPVVLNNLASLLLQNNHLNEAEQLILQALKKPAEYRQALEQTLSEIRAALAAH